MPTPLQLPSPVLIKEQVHFVCRDQLLDRLTPPAGHMACAQITDCMTMDRTNGLMVVTELPYSLLRPIDALVKMFRYIFHFDSRALGYQDIDLE